MYIKSIDKRFYPGAYCYDKKTKCSQCSATIEIEEIFHFEKGENFSHDKENKDEGRKPWCDKCYNKVYKVEYKKVYDKWWEKSSAITESERTQGIVHKFPAGYHKVGTISVENCKCDMCSKEKDCIVIDSSEGEYGGGAICKACIEATFIIAKRR